MSNTSGIVQDIQQGQGTQEHTYFSHAYEDDTTTQEVVTGIASGVETGADAYSAYQKAQGKKPKDLSPMMTDASKLVKAINNSPQEMDPTEKQDKISQFYITYGKNYTITEMNQALSAMGGEELIKSAYEPYRTNAEKYEAEQKSITDLGWRVNPNAADSQSAMAAGYNYMSNAKYILDGANQFSKATTNSAKAQSLMQMTPAMISNSAKDAEMVITSMGGIHNLTTYQIEDLKTQMRANMIQSKLPGEFADYIVNRTFYGYEKIAKANDKDKSEAITQLKNTQAALEIPAVVHMLQSKVPVYGEMDPNTGAPKKTGELSYAQIKAMYDVLGKENAGYLTNQLGGAKFIEGLTDAVANKEAGTKDPYGGAYQKALGESFAYLVQGQPKVMNDIAYNNPEGSAAQQIGEQIGKDADEKIYKTIQQSIGKFGRESSTMVQYINKNKNSVVTPSMQRSKRANIDSFLDTIAKEYAEVYNSDNAIPMINPETGDIRLFEFAKASNWPVFGNLRAKVGGEITTTSATAEQTVLEEVAFALTPDAKSSISFYGKEKERLQSALKELSRETGYSVKDIYKQYNNAVSRATGLFPKQINEAVNTPTEKAKIAAEGKEQRELNEWITEPLRNSDKISEERRQALEKERKATSPVEAGLSLVEGADIPQDVKQAFNEISANVVSATGKELFKLDSNSKELFGNVRDNLILGTTRELMKLKGSLDTTGESIGSVEKKVKEIVVDNIGASLEKALTSAADGVYNVSEKVLRSAEELSKVASDAIYEVSQKALNYVHPLSDTEKDKLSSEDKEALKEYAKKLGSDSVKEVISKVYGGNIKLSPITMKAEGKTQVNAFSLDEKERVYGWHKMSKQKLEEMEERFAKEPFATEEMEGPYIEATKEFIEATKAKEAIDKEEAFQEAKKRWLENQDEIRNKGAFIDMTFRDLEERMKEYEEYLYHHPEDDKTNERYIEVSKEYEYYKKLKEAFDKEYKKFYEATRKDSE